MFIVTAMSAMHAPCVIAVASTIAEAYEVAAHVHQTRTGDELDREEFMAACYSTQRNNLPTRVAGAAIFVQDF